MNSRHNIGPRIGKFILGIMFLLLAASFLGVMFFPETLIKFLESSSAVLVGAVLKIFQCFGIIAAILAGAFCVLLGIFFLSVALFPGLVRRLEVETKENHRSREIIESLIAFLLATILPMVIGVVVLRFVL